MISMPKRAHPFPGPICAIGGATGFTLIEVLVALFVLSLGLLGLAALQTTSLQFNHEAYLRSQATTLAYDIADRMRANRQAALNGDYDVAFAASPPACGGAGGGASVAARDLSAWRDALACTLPRGEGRIDVANRIVTIAVRWDESRGEGETGVLQTFEITTRF